MVAGVNSKWLKLVLALGWVVLLAFFFANVEVQIEGASGWAASLPTWRIEQHWLLDIFWGGRVMTGYHAWVFPFIAMFFHFPLVFSGAWQLAKHMQIIAFIMVFWIVEDFLWFVINPAFGLQRFTPTAITWHKHWFLFAPTDYWLYLTAAILLLLYSLRDESRTSAEP